MSQTHSSSIPALFQGSLSAQGHQPQLQPQSQGGGSGPTNQPFVPRPSGDGQGVDWRSLVGRRGSKKHH